MELVLVILVIVAALLVQDVVQGAIAEYLRVKGLLNRWGACFIFNAILVDDCGRGLFEFVVGIFDIFAFRCDSRALYEVFV